MPESSKNRADAARRAAELIRSLDAEALARVPAMVGFDGFIDSINRVVDRRRTMAPGDYEPIDTIAAFAARVGSAAGKSTNIELVVAEERFGGNGPLMAGAIAQLGMPTTYIGAVGRVDSPHELHPLWAEFAERCERVIPLCPPSFTDALEFDDGKVMLGKPANMQAVTWDSIKDVIGLDEIRRIVGASALIGIVNWTLCGGVEGIWRGLIDEVLPEISPDFQGNCPTFGLPVRVCGISARSSPTHRCVSLSSQPPVVA